MGSKNRYAKELLSIILKNRKPEQWYVEPFVGAFNVIDKVSGSRIGNDENYYLIELFKAVQSGWCPPNSVSETEYKHVKDNKEKYPPHLVGFIGFGCSYAGKWFGGYARGNDNNGQKRNYCRESQKNILNQLQGIQGITIHNKSYLDLEIPPQSIIYCDPPYEKTTSYKSSFDSKTFWDWVRMKYSQNHKVFISEYTAPNDFIPVWSKKVNNTLVKGNRL
jgi:DNA adenine methylase